MSALPPLPPTEIERLVTLGLSEDLRSGDATSAACIDMDHRGLGELVAREHLVLCGLEVAEACFRRLDPGVRFEPQVLDGEERAAGGVIAKVDGRLRGLLSAERVALNYLQRASGIATKARRLASSIADLGVDLLDTRKTTPGLRMLEKQAVLAGGGVNHRFALDDMLMVKDNHVIAAGGLRNAVELALTAAGHAQRVEVEVDSLAQLEVLLGFERLPDVVMLDNFTPDEVRTGVALVAGRVRTEVSGGINEESLRSYAEAGPDAISMGALTHSVMASDIAFDLTPTTA